MTRGVRLYLVGSFVLVSLAGCGRGLFQSAEREPWRAEAEVACLKSGSVRENPDLVRINPISGPGVCGAEFPLKVAALGESNALGFADDLRPPAGIGSGPHWNAAPRSSYPEVAVRQPDYDAALSGPISLSAPGVSRDGGDEISHELAAQPANSAPQPPLANPYATPDYARQTPLPRLGPPVGSSVAAFGPVALKPTATLACPIVSALDKWLADSVQPAAIRWFGVRVAEIKQISAYSCRGMNGNSRAHISEHAFGNALDVAAFTLADGRRISVKTGWKGMPEEQGFLRDVQAAACQQFNTVLAPGSNVYHYDHIHVDLMRRSRRRVICQPAAVSGEEIAARAQQRGSYANRETPVTGSIGGRRAPSRHAGDDHEDFGNE